MMLSKVTQVVEDVECPAWIAELVELAKYNMSVLYPRILGEFDSRYKSAISELLEYSSLEDMLQAMQKYSVNRFINQFLVMRDFWPTLAHELATDNLCNIIDSDIRSIAKKIINSEPISDKERTMIVYYGVEQGDRAYELKQRMRPDPRLYHESNILSVVSSIQDGCKPWTMPLDYAGLRRPYLIKYIRLSVDAFRAMNNGL